MSVFLERYNERRLSPPPFGTTGYGAAQIQQFLKLINQQQDIGSQIFGTREDIGRNILESLEECKKQITLHDKHLTTENSIMFTYVYQTGRHRKEKFYSGLKKVSTCIRRWQEVELLAHINRFEDILKNKEADSEATLYLPNILWVDYMLSQLKVTFELMLKLASYSFDVAILLRSKIAIGHFPVTAVVFLSSVARIRILGISMATALGQCFDNIRPIYIILQKVIAEKTVEVPILSPKIQLERRSNCWCHENTRKSIRRNKRRESARGSENEAHSISIVHNEDGHSCVEMFSDSLKQIEFPSTINQDNYLGEPVARKGESNPTKAETILPKKNHRSTNDHQQKNKLSKRQKKRQKAKQKAKLKRLG